MSRIIEKFFVKLADIFRFVISIFKQGLSAPFEFSEFIRQCFEIGWRSLPLASIAGWITGFVFITQTKTSLDIFGNAPILPGLLAIAVVRSLAPLLTALVLCGRVASQIAAEINAMRVTEQLDAMEVSGTNPVKFLLSTRVFACLTMLPILCFYAMLLCFWGGYTSISTFQQWSLSAFFDSVLSVLSFADFIGMLCRSLLFGLVIGICSCYVGYFHHYGAQGVGKAAHSAVVNSIYLVFLSELLLLRLFSIF